MWFTLFLAVATARPAASQAPEVRIKDTVYQARYARLVELYETAEAAWRNDPEGTRKRIEKEILADPPEHIEVVLVVRFSEGINTGAEKERHAFHPHRLAGRCALAADDPAGAVAHFEKAAGCADLLEKAQRALKARQEAAAVPDLAPLLAKRDFPAALPTVRKHREQLGNRAPALEKKIRDAAETIQRDAARRIAAALPRLGETAFRQEHVAPFLADCACVPPELERPETRWIRALDAWLVDRPPARRDALAVEAAKLEPAFLVFCRHAQQARLDEIRGIVEGAVRAPRADRPALLSRLAVAEKAFNTMAGARPYPDLRETLTGLKGRLPVDLEVLDRARAGVRSIADIRALADALERVWGSEVRRKLSVPDAADLARHLAVHRSLVLFLDGKTVREASLDYLVREAFRAASPLPPDTHPKVDAVRKLVR